MSINSVSRGLLGLNKLMLQMNSDWCKCTNRGEQVHSYDICPHSVSKSSQGTKENVCKCQEGHYHYRQADLAATVQVVWALVGHLPYWFCWPLNRLNLGGVDKGCNQVGENWIWCHQWSAIVDEGGEFDCLLVACFNLSGERGSLANIGLTEQITKFVPGWSISMLTPH